MIEKLAAYFVPKCMWVERRQEYQTEIINQLEQLERVIPRKDDFYSATGYLALIAGFARRDEARMPDPSHLRRDQAALRELLNAYRATEDREALSSYLWDRVTSINQLQGKIRAASTTENAISSAGLASGIHQTRDPGLHRKHSMLREE